MSVRLLSMRLAKHARNFLQNYCKRDIHNNILDQKRTRNSANYVPANFVRSTAVKGARSNALEQAVQSATTNAQTAVSKNLGRTGLFRFGVHARKLFVDNILNRVTTTYSEKLRQQATKKLFFGDSAPFLALIGVSLASGAGVLTKEDELEGVCWEIREAANRLQSTWNHDEISETLNSDFNIDKLNIGQAIAKGCAAVVYAANFKREDANAMTYDNATAPATSFTVNRTEMMTPIQNISRFVHNFGGSVDNLHAYTTELQQLSAQLAATTADTADEAKHSSLASTKTARNPSSIEQYPLALKMMFNYDIQSNALSILRAMYKETVPARQRHMPAAAEEWQRLLQHQTLILPVHPNIVCMYGFFCDEVGNFPDGQELYPIAQPRRINPLGYGRNMSLYLLMKRYDCSLRAMLDNEELSARSRLLLLAQLLEAVAHLNRHGIAHRDLKTDNLLIEKNDDNTTPVLVISDFGCCLADKKHGLQIPFTSYDIDKGGNAALMPPEIINKQPGPFAELNYEKADLWACGAMAYEIFGLPNPFYNYVSEDAAANNALRSNSYKAEQLPNLNSDCPVLVQQLIHNILDPNPAKRLSVDVAANVLQLLLWSPSKWLKTDCMPNSTEILQWLLSLTTKVLCEGRFNHIDAIHLQSTTSFRKSGRRTYVEYLLISSFLSRARLRRIRDALNWIHSVYI